MIQIRPLRNQVVLRVQPLPPRSTILVTPGDQVTCRTGIVEAVGPRCRYAQVGMTVLYHSLVGHDLGSDQRLLSETDLLADLPVQ